jgi:hypothetical protein
VSSARHGRAGVVASTLVLASALVLGSGCRGREATPRGQGAGATELAPANVTAPPLAVVPSPPAGERIAAIEVALRDDAICVRTDGRVYCGTDAGGPITALAPLAGIDDAVAIASAGATTCAVVRSGKVLCAGGNRNGELGAHLRAESSDAAVAALGIDDAKRVVLGRSHACAIRTKGLSCWGSNTSGQTGGTVAYRGEARELVEPVAVSVPSPLFAAATNDSTCAITSRREVYCWGTAVLGAEEKERGVANERPWHAEALDGLEDIDGGDEAFCGVRAGAIVCWGSSYSLFGDFRGRSTEPRPIALPRGVRARKVRVAATHACALTTDGRVLCWGSSWARALGRETGEDPSATFGPEQVVALPPAVDIAVGGSMSCAIVDGGDVYCWGRWPWASGHEARVEITPVKLRIRD